MRVSYRRVESRTKSAQEELDSMKNNTLTFATVILFAIVYSISCAHTVLAQTDSKVPSPATATDDLGATSANSPSTPSPSSEQPTEPQTVLDGFNRDKIKPIVYTVEVHAESSDEVDSKPPAFRAGGLDIANSAGTYGDMSRYLQLFPVVVATSDLSNEIRVGGGHPTENLFLVDGFEVPNINHLSSANTTGGLAPMIDAAAIKSLTFRTGGYDSSFRERLSSVTELETLSTDKPSRHLEGDLGIQGGGGLLNL